MDQDARGREVSAHSSDDETVRQWLPKQCSLLDQLREQIPVLEQRISDQQMKIRRLEEQLDASMVHEETAKEQAGVIASLTNELEALRSKSQEQQAIIDELRADIIELEGLRGVISSP
ncbi:hypothetical protein AURDEDRAFT_166259 [Auricularia subglabra TFB-10046 SS5]|nr:hypothetical protein AURDEDRAFT_166259 [Auricularia subglabra TFB-10046 SS5]